MTRTTIDLDPAVLRQLRDTSRRSGRPMGAVASEALGRALAEERPTTLPAFDWVDRDLGAPMIELEDKEAVRAVLDR